MKEDVSNASLLSKDEGYIAISPLGGCILLWPPKSWKKMLSLKHHENNNGNRDHLQDLSHLSQSALSILRPCWKKKTQCAPCFYQVAVTWQVRASLQSHNCLSAQLTGHTRQCHINLVYNEDDKIHNFLLAFPENYRYVHGLLLTFSQFMKTQVWIWDVHLIRVKSWCFFTCPEFVTQEHI